MLIVYQLKEDSTLDPTKQMNLSALTKAVAARVYESDVHKFGIETYMRVALFVRSCTHIRSIGTINIRVTAQGLPETPRRRLLG